MRKLNGALLIFLTLGPSLGWAGHSDGGNEPDAPHEHWDFTANDGTNCRFVDGGLECEDAGGAGYSTTCELRPDLCASGSNTNSRSTNLAPSTQGTSPGREPGERFLNERGQACKTLETGTQICWNADGTADIVSTGDFSPGQNGSDPLDIFRTEDGFICEMSGGFLTCEQRDANGELVNGFSTSCELRPDICPQNQSALAGNNTGAKTDAPPGVPGGINPGVAPALNPIQGPPPLPASNNTAPFASHLPVPGSTPPPSTLPSGQTPQEGDGTIGGDFQAPLSDDYWMGLPENDLRDANTRLDEIIQAARTGADEAMNRPLAMMGRVRTRIWHAIAHRVSRDQVLRRLPQKYYATTGIFEIPEPIIEELTLIAEPMLPALLRDVSLGEECLGMAPGARAVRHVDMIKQCVDLPFGERRKFKI
ncbi:MAG: hypothetical protein HYT79_08055 [Elusimicrobia bacterium]|nr:hypothetical protein [Elusimicrobiota bacterium]